MLLQTFHDFTRHAMSPLATVLLHAAMTLYLIAAVLSLISLMAPKRLKMRWAEYTGAAGTLSLLAFFIVRVSQAGTDPFSNLFEVVTLSALFLGACHLAVMALKRMPTLAAFTYPALVIVFLVNLAFAATAAEGADSDPTSAPVVLHVVLTVLSYALFFMAAVSAVMYLMQEKALKLHKNPRYIRNFPPLEALKRQMQTCLHVGLPMLTVGFVLGFLFGSNDWSNHAHNMKIGVSVLLWLVMLGVVVGSRVGVLHGRRQLLMVLVGFVLVVVSYVFMGIWTSASNAG
jgi:ABC-type uncharacterized transport system permease subunit